MSPYSVSGSSACLAPAPPVYVAGGRIVAPISRFILFAYGLAAYLLFVAAFLYAIGFVGNLWVPKAIDDGAVVSLPWAMLANVLLLLLFAVQHNLMAHGGSRIGGSATCPGPPSGARLWPPPA